MVEGRAALDDADAPARLKLFERKPMAEWFAVNMPDIDFQDIYYYLRPRASRSTSGTSSPKR